MDFSGFNVPKEKKLKVAMYLRVSSNDQVDQYGIDVQRTKIENRLKHNEDKYELAGPEYIYNESEAFGISGKMSFDKRPVGLKLLQDLQRYQTLGQELPFDIVLVYKLDRIARKVQVLYNLINQLEEFNVTIASATENFDASTPFGRAIIGILGVFAELERDTFMEKSSAGKEESKKAGDIQSEFYGYEKDLDNKPVVYQPESEVIKTIFQKFVFDDLSIKKIADYLRNEEVFIPSYSALNKGQKRTKAKENKLARIDAQGKGHFNRTDKTIRVILQDERYIGNYYYNKTKVDNKTGKNIQIVKDQWKLSAAGIVPILTEDIFKKAQNKLQQGRKTKSIDNTPYLLSTLLYCDFCKEHRLKKEMCTRAGKPSKGGGEEIYLCYGRRSDRNAEGYRCTCQPLNRKDLDKLVLFHILQLLKNPESLNKIIEEMILLGDTQKELSNRQNKLFVNRKKILNKIDVLEKRFHTDWQVEDMTEEVYLKYRMELEEQLSKNDNEIIEVTKKLEKNINIESYLNALQIINTKISDYSDDLLTSFASIKKLLEYVVKRIIIYSKTAESYDGIPGKRGKNLPAIPYKIRIELKLPQEYIDSFFGGYDGSIFGNSDDSIDPKDTDTDIGNDVFLNDEVNISNTKKGDYKKEASKNVSNLIHTKKLNPPLIIILGYIHIFFIIKFIASVFLNNFSNFSS